MGQQEGGVAAGVPVPELVDGETDNGYFTMNGPPGAVKVSWLELSTCRFTMEIRYRSH